MLEEVAFTATSFFALLYHLFERNLNMKRSIVVCVLIISFIFLISCKNKEIKKPDLPDIENVVSMSLEFDGECETVEEKEWIKTILSDFSTAKTTDLPTLNDVPTVENYVLIYFVTTQGKSINMYVYENEDKYYLEQAYYGVFEIQESTYKNVCEKVTVG